MSDMIQRFAKKLIELSYHTSEKEIFQTLTNALDQKLETYGISGDQEQQIVTKIRQLVEDHYDLKKGALINSFNSKERRLTEPKFLWVVISLHVFEGDRPKLLRVIGNGCNRQKIYSCMIAFENLNDKIPHERRIKETYNEIIQSYE